MLLQMRTGQLHLTPTWNMQLTRYSMGEEGVEVIS